MLERPGGKHGYAVVVFAQPHIAEIFADAAHIKAYKRKLPRDFVKQPYNRCRIQAVESERERFIHYGFEVHHGVAASIFVRQPYGGHSLHGSHVEFFTALTVVPIEFQAGHAYWHLTVFP